MLAICLTSIKSPIVLLLFFNYIMKYDCSELHKKLDAGNHSYSGNRDQEDHGLKPAWTNSSCDHMKPYLKKTHHKKRAGVVVKGIDPEFKPSTAKQTNKKTKERYMQQTRSQ
jgi:hypothetical protein